MRLQGFPGHAVVGFARSCDGVGGRKAVAYEIRKAISAIGAYFTPIVGLVDEYLVLAVTPCGGFDAARFSGAKYS